jgi:hypothetical protein
MKRIYLLSFLVLLACGDEGNVDLANGNTFVRYFNGGQDDVAVLAQETADNNIIIMATTEIESATAGEFFYRIKLIKTDAFGNILSSDWPKSYPSPDQTPTAGGSGKSYRGRSLTELPNGGFAIIGDDLLAGPLPQLRVIVTDPLTGEELTVSHTYTSSEILPSDILSSITPGTRVSLVGYGISVAPNGNYILLAGLAVEGLPTKNMLVAEVRSSDLTKVWSRAHGTGTSTLARTVLVNTDNSLTWGGTVTNTGTSDARLIRAFPDAQTSEFDLTYGNAASNEIARDVAAYGTGYAMAGTTDNTANQDNDILYTRIGEDGGILTQSTFGYANLNEEGISVCTTRDGNVLLISTTESGADQDNKPVGNGLTDVYLMKLTPFGSPVWSYYFGSGNNENAASVRQMSDGSILVLGTADFAGLKTIMLVKTSEDGKL